MVFLLSSNGIAYLCGHLHTMLGTFPQIHAVHSVENFMELELGDWKENRRYVYIVLVFQKLMHIF